MPDPDGTLTVKVTLTFSPIVIGVMVWFTPVLPLPWMRSAPELASEILQLVIQLLPEPLCALTVTIEVEDMNTIVKNARRLKATIFLFNFMPHVFLVSYAFLSL